MGRNAHLNKKSHQHHYIAYTSRMVKTQLDYSLTRTLSFRQRLTLTRYGAFSYKSLSELGSNPKILNCKQTSRYVAVRDYQ